MAMADDGISLKKQDLEDYRRKITYLELEIEDLSGASKAKKSVISHQRDELVRLDLEIVELRDHENKLQDSVEKQPNLGNFKRRLLSSKKRSGEERLERRRVMDTYLAALNEQISINDKVISNLERICDLSNSSYSLEEDILRWKKNQVIRLVETDSLKSDK